MKLPELLPIPDEKPAGKLTFDVPHEITKLEAKSLETLLVFGDDIIHLEESQRPHTHTPDMIWRGEHWELKTVTGDSRNNVFHAVAKAKKQSLNVVIHAPNPKQNEKVILRDFAGGLLFYRMNKGFAVIGHKYCFLNKNMLK